MDFTAEWCLNCKALEEAVLHRADVVQSIRDQQVVPIKVDLTGNNVPGKAMLRDVGAVAIPLLAVFGPGLPEPFVSEAYTPSQVIEAIAEAKGTKGAGSPASPQSSAAR